METIYSGISTLTDSYHLRPRELMISAQYSFKQELPSQKRDGSSLLLRTKDKVIRDFDFLVHFYLEHNIIFVSLQLIISYYYPNDYARNE